MKPTLDAPSLTPSPVALSSKPSVPAHAASNSAAASGRTLTQGRWWLWVGSAWVVTVVVFVGCLGFGTQSIPYSRIIAAVMGSIVGASMDQGLGDPTSVILLQVRMPRVLLAFFVGGSLAMVGVALQALLRNPLADPFVIGISSGAALGAAIALLFGLGNLGGKYIGVACLCICRGIIVTHDYVSYFFWHNMGFLYIPFYWRELC